MSNENYKGTIELISGIKQKNNVDFPLVEAHAVAVYEDNGTEVRLDEKLKKLKEESSISDTAKKEIIEAATDAVFLDEDYVALTQSVEKNSSAIFAAETGLDSRVKELESQIDEGDNAELKLQYEEKESMLYLYTGDELIKPNPDDPSVVTNVITSTPVSGGGGAGASLNYKLALKILDKSGNLTFLHTDTPKIKYIANFTDTSVEEGENNLVSQRINFKLTVELPSGAKNTYSFTEMSNTELEYDLTSVLSSTSGLIIGDHNISLTASYTQEVGDEAIPVTIQSTKKWIVKVTEMYLQSTFDDSGIKTGNVPFTVKVFGDLNKTIHYDLNGQKDWHKIENASLSNYDYTISIPKQAHGNYPLEVYLTADVNGTIIRSDSLFYDIMFVEDGKTETIIRAVPAASKGQQYSNTTIYYTVYNPLSELSKVELIEDGKVLSSLENVDRSEKEWNYKPMDFGTKTLTIKSGEATRVLSFEVEEFPYKVEGFKAGLELDFLPQGRSNQDSDYDKFHNNVFDEDGNEIPLDWTLSENFDWVNGGWKTDENGDSYFCVKAGTSVDINYFLFNDQHTLVGDGKSKGNGKEFKIIFKTTNVARPDATWLSCLGMPDIGSELGLKMDVQSAYVKTNLEKEVLTIPYSEEDKIELDINIVPITYNSNGEIDGTVKDVPMIMPYEDGTPARPLLLKDDTISFKQVIPVPITIGSPHCDVFIYRMKAYGTYLSDKDVLNNFIADASNAEDMASRYKSNQIYDSKTNKLTPEALAAACPHLRIIKLSAPYFTNDKKDKVEETTIEMIYKDGDPKYDNWKAVHCIHNGQGTSSNAYGYAGRNLELNMKKKTETRYRINVAEGVFNEDGEHIEYGEILTKEIPLYDSADPETRVLIEDINSVATAFESPGSVITLGDGQTVKKVDLTRDSVPTNYFNVKVNIASSEQANNALLQRRYDRYIPYTSAAKYRDPKVKNTMNFFNCVIFVQETNEDLTTHREFNDNEWHFYSIGNIGDSKKTDDSRTVNPDDPNEFCVEIMDWNRELSEFPKDTMVKCKAEKYEIKDETGTTVIGYTFLNEEYLAAGALYEKDADGNYTVSKDETIDQTNLDKYYIDILEHDDFSEDYTYGWRYAMDDEDPEILAGCKAKWIEFYRFLTKDLSYDDKRKDENGKLLEDPAKIVAWKEEFKDWFIIDAAFYYYLFTLRYTMVDNRAKNSFWHYGKCVDGKYRFDFWDYDNDTAFGIDNTGLITMDYGVEDHDTNEGGVAHFRGHNSTFFVRVAEYFANEIFEYYKGTLEALNPQVFSSTSLINEFDQWQSEFPEELWRLQYDRVYKRTYVGGYGSDWDNAVNPAQIKKAADPQFLEEMMNGKKKYFRRRFERNQDIYMSSKFFGDAVFQDYLKLRGGGDMSSYEDQLVVKPSGDITITPYLNMYVNTAVEHNSKPNHHVKVKAGESVTLPYPTKSLEFNYIYGASYLQSLGDLSAMYLRTAELNNGRRLKQIILGNTTEGYNNPNLQTLAITSSNKLLEELDIRNMSNLGGSLPIINIPSLRKLYAQGTNYQTVQFANRGLIEEAYLPASVTILRATNLYYLTKLELEGYSNLQLLLIDNCAKLPNIQDIATKAVNLKTVKLTNIDWRMSEGGLLNRLLNCTGIGLDNSTSTDQSVLTGKVYIENIRQAELDAYKAAWPELDISYNYIVPQSEVFFYNEDKTLLGSTMIDVGTYPFDPVEGGLFGTPTKESTDQYHFTFAGWSLDGENIVDITTIQISQSVSFYAVYSKTIRQYTVKWYADTYPSTTVLHSATVNYGDSAEYNVIPTKSNFNTLYYLFDRWSEPTTSVEGDMDVYPVWAMADGATIFNSLNNGAVLAHQLKDIEIYAVTQYQKGNAFSVERGDFIELQLGYMPTYSEDPSKERVLSENLVLNGSNYQVFDDIELFNEDKSFVIALDFTPGYVSSGTYSFLSCYRGAESAGLRITSASPNYPQLNWTQNAATAINPSKKVTTSSISRREICVIRKVKGDTNLYLYRHDRYGDSGVEVVALNDIDGLTYEKFKGHKVPLTIGADYITSPSNIAKAGTIHYAKIWFNDIGDEDCRNICAWTYNKMKFDFVGGNRYYYSGTETKASASFVAQNLLDDTREMFKTAQKGGWAMSDMRAWLNDKMLKGVSPIWRQILRQVIIKSMQSGGAGAAETAGRTTITQSNNYFYLPSLAEVNATIANANSGDNAYFKTELLEESDGNYPVFGDNNEKDTRIKCLDGTNQAATWFTRSPFYSNNSGLNATSYYTAVFKDGSAENTFSYQDQDTGTYVTINSYKPFGICVCFSI